MGTPCTNHGLYTTSKQHRPKTPKHQGRVVSRTGFVATHVAPQPARGGWWADVCYLGGPGRALPRPLAVRQPRYCRLHCLMACLVSAAMRSGWAVLLLCNLASACMLPRTTRRGPPPSLSLACTWLTTWQASKLAKLPARTGVRAHSNMSRAGTDTPAEVTWTTSLALVDY